MKTALLIAAHGSPLPEANSEIYRVAEDVISLGSFDPVEVCFLECNEPAIPEAIESCVVSGAERVILIPYFLHAGRHVVLDLPVLLEDAGFRYPNVEFKLADYLGCSSIVTEIIQTRAEAAAPIR